MHKVALALATWLALAAVQDGNAGRLADWTFGCVGTGKMTRIPNDQASNLIGMAQADFARHPYKSVQGRIELRRSYTDEGTGDVLLDFDAPGYDDIGLVYRFDRQGKLLGRVAYSYWIGPQESCEKSKVAAAGSS